MFSSDYYLDVSWLQKLSSKLENFKAVGSGQRVFNCRCPICGDSKKRKRLARCYFYTSHDSLNVSCKNCDYSRSFYNFVKEVFPEDFETYKMDQLKARLNVYDFREESASAPDADANAGSNNVSRETNRVLLDEHCVNISKLSDDHPAVVYLKGRALPETALTRLYYCDDFKELAAALSYKELSGKFPHGPRIVIPFFAIDGSISMIQGRSLNPDDYLRYITIKSDENIEKVYGLDAVDYSKPVYVCEGPLDSLFLDNCIASCDSSLTRLKGDVYIWDNEPRNPEIIKLMSSAIDNGKSVVIWPWTPDKKVDMNDMIKGGIYTITDLKNTIQKNTFSGIKAKINFGRWKRC